jgi:hypothetical protein
MTDEMLKRMLVERGVAATSILANQVETHIANSDGVFAAYAQMPVPVVCWYLGYLTAELMVLERSRAVYPQREARARSISSTVVFLRDTAELNSRQQPHLAEQALMAVDGFNDDLSARPRYQTAGVEDLTYGDLIVGPLL